MLISHTSLKSIPTWQLKEGPCGSAGNISHAGSKKKNPTHDCSIWSEILIFQPGKQVAARCRYFICLMCMLASSHRSTDHHVYAETPRAAANRHRILEAVVHSGKFQIKLFIQQIKDRLRKWTQLFRVNTDDLLRINSRPYLRFHLIQNWVVWSKMDGLVPFLNGLPMPEGNTWNRKHIYLWPISSSHAF